MEETSEKVIKALQEVVKPDEVSVDFPMELPGIDVDIEEEEVEDKLSDDEMIMIIRGKRPARIPQEIFKILKKNVDKELREKSNGKMVYTSSFLETRNGKVKKVNNVPYVKPKAKKDERTSKTIGAI